MTPERMLVVICPDWPVVAAGFTADIAVAVLAANVVAACSAAARTEGVQQGLRRRLAESRCPGLAVIDHDPSCDARAFEPVVAAVESFTPRVEVLRPGACAFATRGPSRYFGGDEALAAKVAEKVDRVLAGRARSCVGVADGRFAAEVAARHDVRVPPGASARFLAPLPVDTLDEPDLVHLLRRLGIRTLGDLAGLSAATVVARFGPAGRLAHRRARGLDDVPLSARIPPPDFTVSVELDPPVAQLETAAFAAKSLADELGDRLAAQGLVVTGVRVEAETEHGEHLVRLWHHDRGLTAGALAQRVRWQLDGWFGSPASSSPTSGLTLLRLVPEKVGPDR
ncbi:MAG: DNA polymerase Y family protein, partial [Actinomycetota bacterium]|nr:DNA polymerase Y family protein [Actinomycetota bacterium]